jgi:hypothetical protein
MACRRINVADIPLAALKALVLLYRRHEAWARRSVYAPMEWCDFKRSRMSNPLSRAALGVSAGTIGHVAPPGFGPATSAIAGVPASHTNQEKNHG